MGKTWEAQTQTLPQLSAISPFVIPEENTSKEAKSTQRQLLLTVTLVSKPKLKI